VDPFLWDRRRTSGTSGTAAGQEKLTTKSGSSAALASARKAQARAKLDAELGRVKAARKAKKAKKEQKKTAAAAVTAAGSPPPPAAARAEAQQLLHAELGALKLGALSKRAGAAGVDEGAIEAAVDEGDKAALIAQIVAVEAAPGTGAGAGAAAAEAQLRAELGELKLGACRSTGVAWGSQRSKRIGR
jgi:hypothetical protein